jgi:hypothetical protein
MILRLVERAPKAPLASGEDLKQADTKIGGLGCKSLFDDPVHNVLCAGEEFFCKPIFSISCIKSSQRQRDLGGATCNLPSQLICLDGYGLRA